MFLQWLGVFLVASKILINVSSLDPSLQMKRTLATVCSARVTVRWPLITTCTSESDRGRRRPWIYQPRAKRKVTTSATLSDLRSTAAAAAAAVFSRKDIEPVLWAGVFGSFAVGKQTMLEDLLPES